ncbi:MAG: histidine-type phosphatase [Bacteroidales bacterium]|nr:histidine-type phosphatase [Bacteroidales bacterium]
MSFNNMQRYFVLSLCLIFHLAIFAQPADKILSKEQLMTFPEKMGSVYYAYPGPQDVALSDAPKGYTPFYISHYGRHGSRFQPNDARYKDVLDIFESEYFKGNLTELGEDVMSRLHKLWVIARGNGGLLSDIGAQQHRDIAKRMFDRFPEVFCQGKSIEARSSVVPRCKASMKAFCASLDKIIKENPSKANVPEITQETKQEFMEYIAYDSPEQKRLEKDTALWRGEWNKYEKERVQGTRLCKTLFKDIKDIDQYEVAIGLYWLAEGMQDVPTDLSLIELFTPEELYNIWTTINYRMYVCNADAPIANGVGIACAKNLLNNIIEKADAAIKGDEECATLRFGHDSHLIRLLSLMKIEGCGAKESDLKNLPKVWQDFYISPMAANLQMVFYRNKSGDVLVKFLHNENEVTIPIKSIKGNYYRWKDVKKYLSNML